MPKDNSGNIFRWKDSRTRIQGIMTKVGGQAFEVARRRLGALYREIVGKPPVRVSDGDVVEYLARGDANTRAYLEGFVGQIAKATAKQNRIAYHAGG